MICPRGSVAKIGPHDTSELNRSGKLPPLPAPWKHLMEKQEARKRETGPRERPGPFCAGHSCGDVDVPTCCDALEACSEYRCPTRHVHVPDVTNVFCRSTTCVIADAARCCSDIGCCYSFRLEGSARPLDSSASANTSRALCEASIGLRRFTGFASMSRCPDTAQEAMEWLAGDRS